MNLGGQSSDLVDLGSYEALIHRHEIKRQLGLGLSVNATRDDGTRAPIDYEATYTALRGAPVVQRLQLTSRERSFSVSATEGWLPHRRTGVSIQEHERSH